MNESSTIPTPFEEIPRILERYMPASIAKGVLAQVLRSRNLVAGGLRKPEDVSIAIEALQKAIEIFIHDGSLLDACKRDLRRLARGREDGELDWDTAAVNVEITTDLQMVRARNIAKTMAEAKGFSKTDQIKIATAVSELARNILRYAEKGRVKVECGRDQSRDFIQITALDQGQGIPNLDEILAGRYKSETGLGLGILGCKRLMDEFDIQSVMGKGTMVTLRKYL